MAVKSTGTLSLTNDIRGEFGGAVPHSMSEYYRNGPRVPSNNANVPTQGRVSMSNFYGAISTVPMTYEIIGAGGEGGGGSYGGNGASGGSSSFGEYNEQTEETSVLVTVAGGAGGSTIGSFVDNGFIVGQPGQPSFYGPGGAGGLNSNSGSQSPGDAAPSTSYGAGGGGGGAAPFSSNNGGDQGNAGTRRTGTLNIVPGTSFGVTIGAGGASIVGGGNGAGGYAKFTIGQDEYEFTAPGFYTFTDSDELINVVYEIIGGGGSGGANEDWGLIPSTPFSGLPGEASSISIGGSTIVTSPGGEAGGTGPATINRRDYSGENSFYGAGGVYGIYDQSGQISNYTSAIAPASNAYGAGGGGAVLPPQPGFPGGFGGGAGGTPGAAYTVTFFGQSITRNVGMPSTGTVRIAPGTVLNITVGAGGPGGSPVDGAGLLNHESSPGAGGYAKLTFGGQTFEYTSPGTYTITVT